MFENLTKFFNNVINEQMSEWKMKNVCYSINLSNFAYARIAFLGSDNDKILLDINYYSDKFSVPKDRSSFVDDFYLVKNRKLKIKRYIIHCENVAQAEQVIAFFNTQYGTQFLI